MKVTRRRSTLEDIDVSLELVNLAYEPESRWKVEKRTTVEELSRIIPDQDLHAETQDYKIVLVLVAEEGEDISMAPAIAQQSRIVGHIWAEIHDHNAYFGMYAVWPSMHGKKLGVTLLNELVKEIIECEARFARRTPVTHLEAAVASENSHLFPLYDKLGFKLTGHDYPVPSIYGPLCPGYENTILKTISRELRPFF